MNDSGVSAKELKEGELVTKNISKREKRNTVTCDASFFLELESIIANLESISVKLESVLGELESIRNILERKSK